MGLDLTTEEEKRIRQKVLKTHDLLQQKYGKLARKCRPNPLDELVHTIVSQNTTETSSEDTFYQLKKKFSDWENLMSASLEDISKAIKGGGLNQTKALRIKRILKRIHRDRGDLSLDFLKDLECREAFKYLVSFKGVGSLTASCVLLFSLNKPVMPVNPHIERVSKRLGWTGSRSQDDEIRALLGKVIPSYILQSLYAQIMKHARMTCKMVKPSCDSCVIRLHCDYFSKMRDK